MASIGYGRQCIDQDDIDAVTQVMRGDFLTQGNKLIEFEEAIARRVGAKYAVAVSNGTAALHLACMAADVGAGNSIVTSPNTFVASANCAALLGAEVNFVDIERATLNMNSDLFEEKLISNANIRAVIPVHFAGLACDMARIHLHAKNYGVSVIEDASHALGALYEDGSPVGNCRYSDMTTFSFHPVKMITTGEGGMITTNNQSLYRKLLRLRSHGINKLDDPLLDEQAAYTDGEVNAWYYEMQELGFNYRLTDMQAALGTSQLKKLDLFIGRRRTLARQYDSIWNDDCLVAPTQVGTRDRSSLHLYPVRIDFDCLGITRHSFMNALIQSGITTQVHYIPVHLHPYYKRLNLCGSSFPVAEEYYKQALSLPIYYSLTDGDQSRVVETIFNLIK